MKKQGDRRGSLFYRKHHDAIVAAVILIPMGVWWIAVCGFPLLFGFVLGFFDMRGVMATPTFNNFANFIAFFTEEPYLRELWNTIWIGVLSTTLTTLAGLGIAVLLNAVGKFRGLYRSVWYLPSVTATVAVAQIVGILFHPENGGINQILLAMGKDPVSPDIDYGLAVAMIMLFGMWKTAGSCAIVWLAGLQSVDRAQYEAAELDGASKWQEFWHITLPGLKPIAVYLIITGIIGAMQIFEPIAFISNGGPYGQTNVLVLRILQDGFTDMNLGMAGASSLILAVIIMAASLTYYKCSRENTERDERRMRRKLEKIAAKAGRAS